MLNAEIKSINRHINPLFLQCSVITFCYECCSTLILSELLRDMMKEFPIHAIGNLVAHRSIRKLFNI